MNIIDSSAINFEIYLVELCKDLLLCMTFLYFNYFTDLIENYLIWAWFLIHLKKN